MLTRGARMISLVKLNLTAASYTGTAVFTQTLPTPPNPSTARLHSAPLHAVAPLLHSTAAGLL